MISLTPQIFLIVCPLVFLAGFVDAIGGGGGLISLPAYLLAGIPPHYAIATNKLSSMCGTALATTRFIINRLINLKLAIPSILAAVLGSSLGANLSLNANEKIMEQVLVFVLPITAFIVLNKKLFHDSEDDTVHLNFRTFITAISSAFLIGIYDGFYGPGTGTFLIIAFTAVAKMSIRTANAQAKAINLTTNVTSFLVFLHGGQVIFSLGLTAAACNMAGSYLGSSLAMKNGSKIVKPIILFVLALFLIKVIA